MLRAKLVSINSASQLGLSPAGLLWCRAEGPAWTQAFVGSECAGLAALAGHPAPSDADASVLYWRSYAELLLRTLCHLPGHTGTIPPLDPPDPSVLSEWVLNAPPMQGAEYLSPEVLSRIWTRLSDWTGAEIESLGGIAAFLHAHAPGWSQVGRVTLHLAENKNDPKFPFAFMASYASGMSASGRLTQLPLGKALQEYQGARNKAALLKLLTPLHQAAKVCPQMAAWIARGDIFHPLAWTAKEAHTFLQRIPAYEDAGLLVRLPNWWKKRAPRPRVATTLGTKSRSSLGLQALLDFKIEVVIDGHTLTRKETEDLLANTDGLALFRGQWIEVDRDKLREALEHWKTLEAAGSISFIEGMRLLAGAPSDLRDAAELDEHRAWSFARPGPALEAFLDQLTHPPVVDPPASLRTTLRPYQIRGLEWLWFCARTGLGACLADDMGLGKTIQVLAALLRKKELLPDIPPCLLVVPASLIGNWKQEAARFAPDLILHVSHRSEGTSGEMAEPDPRADLVITTYGMLSRIPWATRRTWSWIILDEAQAIKNHLTAQGKAVRRLKAASRIALTGTPVENSLGDLWSIFDFLNPGLLGTAAQFQAFVKSLRTENADHYAPLRRLVAPYILRRLKTDRSIISDLPDKTEMKVFCGLTPVQTRLYQTTARDLEAALDGAAGMQRRGLVLSYLMRFKQICNHPDQFSKAGGYAPEHSAKFLRLMELCGEMASRGEKALVFTQFREMTEPLEACLAPVFGRRGLILHGGSAVRERQSMVESFQRHDGPPFFVLSLKAGGTGLNLTEASQVIHFDRWWNPAAENQATDRAFRIGQHRNVLVHKFVTIGTLEEKIDALLAEKQNTSDAVLTAGTEKILTEMSNTELLQFIRLDLHRAAA